MSIEPFERSTFAPITKVDPVTIAPLHRIDLADLNAVGFEERNHAMFIARCQQVVALRLTNSSTNSVFAQVRQTPKRRKLLCA
ncbi:MAG: hypothetical protein RIR95_1043 [Pseudomonadota bacterium]